jgi:hypothetical protein
MSYIPSRILFLISIYKLYKVMADIFFFFLWNWSGVWTQALLLQSGHFITWSSPSVHLSLFTFWRCDFETICLGWPQTMILPISASQVARITGVILVPAHCDICFAYTYYALIKFTPSIILSYVPPHFSPFISLPVPFYFHVLYLLLK